MGRKQRMCDMLKGKTEVFRVVRNLLLFEVQGRGTGSDFGEWVECTWGISRYQKRASVMTSERHGMK